MGLSRFFHFMFFFALVASSARADVREDFRVALQNLNTTFKARYSNYVYKNKIFAWDMDREYGILLNRGLQNPNLTLLQARNLINEYTLSARDYHAQSILAVAPFVNLDIAVHSVEGRVFVTYTDPKYVGKVTVGDEVLLFNGQSAMAQIQKLRDRFYNLPDLTLRDAERRLTSRYGILMDPIPAELFVKVRVRKVTGAILDESLPWHGLAANQQHSPHKNLEHLSVSAAYPVPESLQAFAEAPIDNPYGYLARAGYLPKPPQVTWESSPQDFFYSWTGVLPSGRRVGLIRLPTFSYGKRELFTQSAFEFQKIVSKMERETDTLIIDILGNRGGNLDFTYALTKFLLKVPTPSMRLAYRLSDVLVENAKKSLGELSAIHTQADVEKYFGGKDYYGFPVDLGFVQDQRNFYQGIIGDANTGAKIGKFRPYNAAVLRPNSTHYTKPIFVMTDAWTASCGDMFAAILQDSKRAVVVGTRSAGAGAFVGSPIKVENALGFGSFRIPIALGLRINNTPLENVGVTPQIPLTPDAFDLSGGNYGHYRARLYQNIDRAF